MCLCSLIYLILPRKHRPAAGKYSLELQMCIKAAVYDSGETLLIFKLNSQTNTHTPLPSVLLQTFLSKKCEITPDAFQ